MCAVPFEDSFCTYRAQVRGDLVGQHLLETQPKEVWRIAAVRSCHHVATGTCGAARAAMTSGATVAESCAQRAVCVDGADPIVCEWSHALTAQELALKQLSPAANGAKRVARDDERRRVGGHPIAFSRPDLLCERFGNAEVGDIRVLRAVGHLGQRR